MKMKMGETKKVVAEEPLELGEEKINYQEYVVPAFLTQVGHDELDADVDEDGEAIPIYSSRQVIYFLAMALTSESFIAERAQVSDTLLWVFSICYQNINIWSYGYLASSVSTINISVLLVFRN